MKYEKLFELKITHNYFNDGGIGLFKIEPTLDCVKILKKQRLLFKKTNNGFVIMAQSNGIIDINSISYPKLNIPFNEKTNLRFLIISDDKSILNYSDLLNPADCVGKTFFLDNQLITSSLVTGEPLCINGVLNAQKIDLIKKNNNAEPLPVSKEEYEQMERMLPFSIVEISVDAALAESCRIINQQDINGENIQYILPKTFNLNINNRFVYWRYKIIQKADDSRVFNIIDSNDPPIVFNQDSTKKVFTSAQKTPLTQKPRQEIALQQSNDNGTTYTDIISDLANPDVSKIKQEGTDYYADILVSV